MDPRQAGNFQLLSDPRVGSVQVTRESAAKLGRILEELPLKFPGEGTYFLSISGRTLHIHEAGRGISRFKTSETNVVTAVDSDEEDIILTVSLSDVSKVVLHREPGSAPKDALQLEELAAPIGAIKEYAALSSRTNPTAAERVRKGELLAEIQRTFVQGHERRERSIEQTRYRSTPEPSGESRASEGSRRAG